MYWRAGYLERGKSGSEGGLSKPTAERWQGSAFLPYPMTVAIGDSQEMQRAIGMLSEVKESIINAYEIKSGLSRAKISRLMDAESWFNAKKAIEMGFADKMLFHNDSQTDHEEELEAVMFSRTAVTNSLLLKLIPPKPENKTPIEQLEKRLSLLAH